MYVLLVVAIVVVVVVVVIIINISLSFAISSFACIHSQYFVQLKAVNRLRHSHTQFKIIACMHRSWNGYWTLSLMCLLYSSQRVYQTLFPIQNLNWSNSVVLSYIANKHEHMQKHIFWAKKWPAFCWFGFYGCWYYYCCCWVFSLFTLLYSCFIFRILFFSAFFDGLGHCLKRDGQIANKPNPNSRKTETKAKWNKADSLGQSLQIYQRKIKKNYQGIAPTTNGIGVESFWQESWSHFLRNRTHRSTSTAPNRLKKKRTKKT